MAFTLANAFFSSCSTTAEDGDIDNGSTIAQELNPAKTFYADKGATFKFRLYRFPPKEGDKDNNFNNHMADVKELIDYNGQISVIAGYLVPAISQEGFGAVLNVQSEIISPESPNAVAIQRSNSLDEFEMLDDKRLISYQATSGAHGAYGFAGQRVFVHSPTPFTGAASASSNMGYMNTLDDSNFMLSMGLNSNYGKPMFYQYIPSTGTWNGTIVPQMDYVQGGGKNYPTTNDAAKVGNTDKVFWVWLSYDNTPETGKINIISFSYKTGFSAKTTLEGIGSVGTTLSMEYKHTIRLYKNPNNVNQPYMVVRRYNTDILDIYKFTGSAIEVVKKGVSIPKEIPIISGTLRSFKDLVFIGNNAYMITGMDKNLYKLSGDTFVVDRSSLTVEGERITAIEGTASGLWLAISKTLLAKPQPKSVSDVILIPN